MRNICTTEVAKTTLKSSYVNNLRFQKNKNLEIVKERPHPYFIFSKVTGKSTGLASKISNTCTFVALAAEDWKELK